MGLKTAIRRWLDIPESMKPVPEYKIHPVIERPESAPIRASDSPPLDVKEIDAAVALAGVLTGRSPGAQFRAVPTSIITPRNLGQRARIVDPNDASALLGSLKR